ncbi:hypothetical protein DL95DRAFT_391555 [Leptodontidium sp. 2 PMI_412]|nr:hypothetical protein DL95DRAFT_391555 [Leptodontidium sp. 2 PMI_412]
MHSRIFYRLWLYLGRAGSFSCMRVLDFYQEQGNARSYWDVQSSPVSLIFSILWCTSIHFTLCKFSTCFLSS